MFSFWLFLIIILIISIIIFFINMKLEIRYIKEGKDDYCSVNLMLTPRIVTLKTGIPVFKWEGNILQKSFFKPKIEDNNKRGFLKNKFSLKKSYQTIKKIDKIMPMKANNFSILLFKKILSSNKDILKRIHCKKLKWVTEVGFSNSALTGISVGIIWGLKEFLYNNIKRKVKVDFNNPHFEVIPNFNNQKVKLNFHCIFTVRTGYIIIAVSRILYIMISTFLLYRGGVKFER